MSPTAMAAAPVAGAPPTWTSMLASEERAAAWGRLGQAVPRASAGRAAGSPGALPLREEHGPIAAPRRTAEIPSPTTAECRFPYAMTERRAARAQATAWKPAFAGNGPRRPARAIRFAASIAACPVRRGRSTVMARRPIPAKLASIRPPVAEQAATTSSSVPAIRRSAWPEPAPPTFSQRHAPARSPLAA